VSLPDPMGRFGPYGGRYVPETLMPALEALEAAYREACADPAFAAELDGRLRDYVGRPTPLTRAERLGERLGLRLYLKREDLCHTGAHKINNALGQVLLARRMGKRRIIAETGAGQHGVATATAAALFGLACEVYMGEEDMRRQELNVLRMRLLGARVVPVRAGTATLKEACSAAIRDWVATSADTHYVIGSVVGPHPYPALVRDLQAVIGREAREQVLRAEDRLPDGLVACVGGGSNSAGLFHPFAADASVRLFGVEAAGEGLGGSRHAASLTAGRPGVLHGSYSYVLQDDDGQVAVAHSISAGLDYPGVGPEHAWWRDSGRARYLAVSDAEAVAGMRELAATEGIVPALETAHAVAALPRIARELAPGAVVILCVSGRGDKDMPAVASLLGGAGEAGDMGEPGATGRPREPGHDGVPGHSGEPGQAAGAAARDGRGQGRAPAGGRP
jgi:tryptophan synthase beta chain